MTNREIIEELRKEKKREYMKEWRANNREKIRVYFKKWMKRNPEKVKERQNKLNKFLREDRKLNPERHRMYSRKYRKKHPEKYRERFQNDAKFRLDKNTGSYIYQSLKSKKAGRKWQELVGYTIEELMKCLEVQFDNDMTWDNYGSYWQVDHIKPRSLFNYVLPEDSEFKKCWALENLQPLESGANLKKSNRY